MKYREEGQDLNHTSGASACGSRLWVAMIMIGIAGLISTPAFSVEGDGVFEDVVCGFTTNLDALLEEFDHQVGDFGNDRLNRALIKARLSVAEAQIQTLIPDLTSSFQKLRAAMRELEKGAAVPVSGNGFADDLASLGSFYAEIFVADLITQAGLQGDVDEMVLASANLKFEQGAVARDDGEWESGCAKFLQAIRILEPELNIGPPCL